MKKKMPTWIYLSFHFLQGRTNLIVHSNFKIQFSSSFLGETSKHEVNASETNATTFW